MSAIADRFRLAIADPETRALAEGIDRFAGACGELVRDLGDDPRVARHVRRLTDTTSPSTPRGNIGMSEHELAEAIGDRMLAKLAAFRGFAF